MQNRIVTIVGSYNVGLFLKGQRLPARGETVIADEFKESGGGKGSNQAVAAARFGAHTIFIGRRKHRSMLGLSGILAFEW